MDHKKRVYLSPPHMSGLEMKYVQEAFDQNWIAPLGPNVDAFEEELATFCQVKHAAALSSGTAAIHLALIMLGVGVDDEVIVSSFTFSASVNPIVYQGAKPVFIDSESTTWNMDPALLDLALKERKELSEKGKGKMPKAIIVVHLYGMPARMEEIMAIANRYNVPVIEDAAEALGSTYKGKPMGSFGKMGILSFNGNKIITTSGGGALLSDDNKLTKKARFLATQARDNAVHYQHSELGYNYRLSNILAGVGRGQLQCINTRVTKKRAIHQFYQKHLDDGRGIAFLSEPDERFHSNRWLTTILIDPLMGGATRETIQQELQAENIESRPLWKPMHEQPIFKQYSAYINGTSDRLFENGLCLPSGSNMDHQTLQRVVEIIKKTLD